MAGSAGENRNTVRISVRAMAERVVRAGDIAAGGSADIMLRAADAHRRVQAAGAAEGYEAERSVAGEFFSEHFRYIVRGRIDGLIKGSPMRVQEIKTVSLGAADIRREDNPVYWAQAVGYGHLLCAETGAQELEIELLYLERDGNGRKSFIRRMSAAELQEEFMAVFSAFSAMCERAYAHAQERDKSLADAFPFSTYRPGQRDMMRYAYLAVREGRRVFVQAPTGIGKTAAAIYPTLRALSSGEAERVFYLTSRGTQARAALGLMHLLAGRGAVCRTISLVARESACFMDEVDCDPQHCPYAAGHYDRADAAQRELIDNERVIDENTVAEYARRHRVCPFELALDASMECDVIICDCNYAFDPRVKLMRYFERRGRHALLVDEAHDLPDRARDMLTAVLSGRELVLLRRELGRVSRKSLIYKKTAALCRAVRVWAQGAEDISASPPEELARAADEWAQAAQEADQPGAAPRLLIAEARYFAHVALEGWSDDYAVLTEGRDERARVTLRCLDASKMLADCFARCRSALLFSATLTPMDYCKRVCGGEQSDPHIILPSPFPRENIFACNVPLDMSYRGRENSSRGAARAIAAMCAARRGNYMAFFPSYEFMRACAELIAQEAPGVELVLQRPELSQRERDEHLAMFYAQRSTSMLMCCVLGGIFSQSIDLPGEALVGAAIVSVGLPRVCPETEAQRRRYGAEGLDGFRYAMQYPGLWRVMQAAGRVIRTACDRGVLLLIDRRFSREDYASLLPEQYLPMPIIESDDVGSALAGFWSKG